MAPFAWMVGEWRGSGWTILPNGQRATFSSRESVTRRLSSNALLVEGRHGEPNNPSRLVHDAIGLLTWDNRAGGYRFRTALATGQGGDFAIEPQANGFTWSVDFPGGRIDYVTEYKNGAWIERGRRTGADGRAVDFFEMTLRRQ